MRLAVIGVAGRGRANLNGVASQEIVALCDVDAKNLEGAKQRFPEADLYADYRELLSERDDLDGVVVSTPDHHHVPAAMLAVRRGLHCYCEKPLSHTVAEARALADAAREAGVVTQMGTQIHAGANYRRVVEVVRSGAIGPVHKVHVWVGKVWGGSELPEPGAEKPESLDWDLWLGPAKARPYAAGYHPGKWREFREFGNGTLGDMACHYMDLPFWALQLSAPSLVTAEATPTNEGVCPAGIRVGYQFEAREAQPKVELVWYDGRKVPERIEGQKDLPGSGVMFVGDRGMLVATYGDYRLLPEEKFTDFEPPEPTIPDSIGHHAEWIRACQGQGDALCHFGYGGPLTEAVLLGTVAERAGRPIRWDADAARVVDDEEANRLLTKSYRDGWKPQGVA